MVQLPANIGLLAIGAQGIFAVLMGFRMTQLRLSQMKSKDKAEHPMFKTTHAIQLNMSEYHALMMVLYAVLHFGSKANGGELSTANRWAILIGALSSPIFGFGAIYVKPAVNPVRAVGALARYASIAYMSYAATQL